MTTKQFKYWMITTVPLFTVGGLAVQAAGIKPMWAFSAGFFLSIPAEMFRDWLLDWKEVEETIDELEPEASRGS